MAKSFKLMHIFCKNSTAARWAWMYFEWFPFPAHTVAVGSVPAGSNWAPQSWIHTWVCDYEILHISSPWGGNLSGEGTGLRSKRAHSSEGVGGAGGAGGADLFETSDLSFSSHSPSLTVCVQVWIIFGCFLFRPYRKPYKFSRCVCLYLPTGAVSRHQTEGFGPWPCRLFTPPPHVAARLRSKDRTTEYFHLFSQPCCWLTLSFCPIVFFSLT